MSVVEKKLQAALDEAGVLRAEMAGLQAKKMQEQEALNAEILTLKQQHHETNTKLKESEAAASKAKQTSDMAMTILQKEKAAVDKALAEKESALGTATKEKQEMEKELQALKDKVADWYASGVIIDEDQVVPQEGVLQVCAQHHL